MVEMVKDLLRGSRDPIVIETYKTSGYEHEGVNGSTPVDRLTENGGKGITPDVMNMQPAPPVQKVVHNSVITKSAGEGMSEDAGSFG